MIVKLHRPAQDQETRIYDVTLDDVQFQITLNRNKPTQRYIADHLEAGMLYETDSTKAILETLKPGDTFFDVGANCGWFSALVQARGCNVVAFEPDEENCRALKRNAPKANIVKAAVTEKDLDTVRLYNNLDNDGGHALWQVGLHTWNTETAQTNPTIIVRSVSLDGYDYEHPTAIKIDTEGGEWGVLAGAASILAQPSLRLVVCERHVDGLRLMGHAPEEIEAIMRDAGFDFDSIHNQDVENWIFTR